MEISHIKMDNCTLCPHECQVDRLKGQLGVCRAGYLPKLARAALHYWEEPPISGENGSGTVFFSHCNLKCVFCQNYDISQEYFGKEISIYHLAEIFLQLQSQGAHNINLVSPTHFMPQIREALVLAKQSGLNIPTVYNSNGYEKAEALHEYMEGLIDIYLPDLKYYSDQYSIKYSKAPHYFEYATKAVLEMYRQVGSPVFDEHGLIKKGIMIRHLMLPGLLEDSKKVLHWIRDNLPIDVYISLMAQYTPFYKAKEIKELNHTINKKQYDTLIDYFFEIGLENGYVQELSSAKDVYTPTFDLNGI